MADFELLKKQRKIVKQALTRIFNYCNDPNSAADQIPARVAKAEELMHKYENIQSQIDDETSEQGASAEERYRSEIEATYFNIKAIEHRLQGSVSTPSVQQTSSQDIAEVIQALTQHQTSMGALMERFVANVEVRNASTPREHTIPQVAEFKLPRIELPDFDGKLLEWVRFKDLFEALVHNRENLANVQKLEYLQSKLKGEALALIKHLPPTNENYTVAWELLKKKFNNVEKIKGAYMELLFDQPPMKSSSLAETKRMYNNINEGFNALKIIDDSVNQWSSVLLFNIEKKLDSNSAMLWYREKKPDEVTTFDHILKFLEKRIFELESMQASHQQPMTSKEQSKRTQTRTYTALVRACPVCEKQHQLFQCENFRKMKVEERRNVVQKHGLCFNCMSDKHKVDKCRSSSCKTCNKRHNTLLHLSYGQRGDVVASATHPEESTEFSHDNNVGGSDATVISSNITRNQHVFVVLPTASITIVNPRGIEHRCRALLDSGSQGTLITEACVQKLGLKKHHDKTTIYGVGSNNGNQTQGKVQLHIKAGTKDRIIVTHAYCLKSLAQVLPPKDLSNKQYDCFSNLHMADPNWNKPGKIDVILGADVFMECCLPQKVVHPSGAPVALNTVFGWVLMGKVQANQNSALISNHVCLDLDKQLRRFWETEELPDTANKITSDEEEAERFYGKTTQRGNDGRYIVRLPFRNNIINIGESRAVASKRLFAMERKFKHNSQIETEYKRFMREYIQLGHMEQIDEANAKQICLLPHHAVMKPTSTTTKLRVVFDASSKTTNGKSLNDNLLVGPKVQRDLFEIIISFRVHAIAFTGDLEKMYRQVRMHVDDRPFQCILWRFNESEQIKTYCLNTVTYGTAAASYLATRTLNKVADDNNATNPTVARVIKESFYVDDLMCSVPHLQEAINVRIDLGKMLSTAGFHIRKWASNSMELLSTIPNEDLAMSLESHIQNESTASTLGLLWNTTEDHFKYSISLSAVPDHVTKREVLSSISKIYDPMGWLAPLLIRMKIFMQKLWLKGVAWDEQLSSDLVEQWVDLWNTIATITEVKIPRWFSYTCDATIELHGYSDASERAYASVVYVKIRQSDHTVHTHLIAAKTRVAPVKQISIPRLELCAAHLLVKLLLKVRISLKMPTIEMHGWTDSTIVLAWISDHPCRWKTFVANRVSLIINVLPAQQWHHVKTQHNPADLATRGAYSKMFINSELWWHGPDELRQGIEQATSCYEVPIDCDMEERKEMTVNAAVIDQHKLIMRYSNFTTLIRITALIQRFIKNCRHKGNRVTGFITTAELSTAHDTLVLVAQQDCYAKELQILSSGRQLPNTHRLSAITPFVDTAGLLRVGGRISNSNVSYQQKHPIILHHQHHLTKLILQHYHIQHCHAGRRLLFYLVHLKYWIASATQAIKSCIYKCTVCVRQNAKPYQQQMAALPKHRLRPAPVFASVGIDFAGPIQVRTWKGRGAKTFKSWIAVFVCLVTKAIHIEVVSELSTAAFIASLRRFVARRGKPAHIYSDNGTNFVGANQQLKDLFEFLKNEITQDNINRHLALQQIAWHFSPPAGPHFGGLWEAGVKSIKYHLKRVLKDAHPTLEEIGTILCQIESCLNSRPLCNKFEGDTDPLTPGHFILLRPMTALPEENCGHLKENRLSRWQYAQRLVQQFWKKWSMEYLHQMQQRPKWKQRLENLSVDDVVLIKDENLAPSHWLVGKVIQLHLGADGLARVATIKTAKGQLKRPIVKLCPLFPDN